MDWADKIAEDWDPKEAIATALRKAKADGMREAAAMLQACERCAVSDHVHELLDRAEHIEKGEV